MVTFLESIMTAVILFSIGILGVLLNIKNLITILISLELMLLAITFHFVVTSLFLDDFIGQLFSLFIVTVAGGESAIGLSILVVFFRITGSISIKNVNSFLY